MITLPAAPASDRNKHPILEQLQMLLKADASVLEIGSGWGQHAVHFCHHMPGLKWQPSERGEEMAPLLQRLAAEGSAGIGKPIKLDVQKDGWPRELFDAVYSANTAHIMSWDAVRAMFACVYQSLASGGLFLLYGPFNVAGRYTSAGNEAFDRQLRLAASNTPSGSSEMGIRDIEALENLAASHQLFLVKRVNMPANNFLLVFEKSKG